jgi:hypothetical protein
MKHTCVIALCLASLLAGSPALAAKVYKWVDEQGVVNFSEHPPKNTKAVEIKPNIGHSEPVIYEKPAAETPAQAAPTEQQASLKDAQRCEIARKNLQVLQTFGRVRVPEKDGSFHYLTEQEQQDRLKTTQQAIDESC